MKKIIFISLIVVCSSLIGIEAIMLLRGDFVYSVIPGWHTTIFPPVTIFGLFVLNFIAGIGVTIAIQRLRKR